MGQPRYKINEPAQEAGSFIFQTIGFINQFCHFRVNLVSKFFYS